MMGGRTKQKHISHDAMGEDKPAPQHLSRQKERPAPERSRAAAPARTPASKETKEASGVGSGSGAWRWRQRQPRSGLRRFAPAFRAAGAARHAPGRKQARSLPVLSQHRPRASSTRACRSP